MAKLIETLCEALAELHETTPEEEYQELKKVKQWFDKQDSETQLWFTAIWFTLDQVRIIKQLSDLAISIQLMTEAMVAVNKIEESDGTTPDDQPKVSQHV